MKKVKLNNKGFMLVETLIVTVFIMSIFSIIYAQFYPIMAEYERREVYDDVDGKYGVYWFKKIIQSTDVSFGDAGVPGTIANNIATNSYHRFDCNTDIKDDITTRNLCNNLINHLQVAKRNDNGDEVDNGKPCIYITNFKLGDSDDTINTFKKVVDNNNGSVKFSSGLVDYVAYLPKYQNIKSVNYADYRLIIEYHRTKDDNSYYAYSTIEVKK